MEVVNSTSELLKGKKNVKVSTVLGSLLRSMKEEDFILRKNYTIVKVSTHS